MASQNDNEPQYEDRGMNTDELPPEVLQKLVDENPELQEEEGDEVIKISSNEPKDTKSNIEINTEAIEELKLKE